MSKNLQLSIFKHLVISLQKSFKMVAGGTVCFYSKIQSRVLIEEVSNHQETLALAGLREVFKSRRAT